MKRAIVVGSEGQDGRLLFDRLVADGWDVTGLGRNSARHSSGSRVTPVDVSNRSSVAATVADCRPDSVFYVAAVHQSSQDLTTSDEADLLDRSYAVHVAGPTNFLDALVQQGHGSFFYAASSLVFGDPPTEVQNELTPFAPASTYAITKVAGIEACRFYRELRGVAASAGILYNHESPLRGPTFISQKIVRSAVSIARGEADTLVVGNLDSRIDWGYAPDFVDAMLRIAELPSGDDYVVATGEAHTVGEFAELAFARLGLDWKAHVSEDPALLTRTNSTRIGDATRLRERTGWRPTVTFQEMVGILVDAAAAGTDA